MDAAVTPKALKSQLKALIVERLQLSIEADAIADDAPLFEDTGLGLDSIDALELVLGIEKALGVRIDDEEVGSEALASIEALAAFVSERRLAG